MTVVVVKCSSCSHSVEVELNKYDGIPTPRKIARIVERIGACQKCSRPFGRPRVVSVRWST
jgi:DNA replicative helicase MCM subunit Mcm2 (Cdc46/Mcm family)